MQGVDGVVGVASRQTKSSLLRASIRGQGSVTLQSQGGKFEMASSQFDSPLSIRLFLDGGQGTVSLRKPQCRLTGFLSLSGGRTLGWITTFHGF